jgi:uncharacterized protein YaiE (UPF0345 family)
VGDEPDVSRRAAASSVHIAGDSTGAVGELPANRPTSELTKPHTASATELTGTCRAVAFDATGRWGTSAGALTSGVIRAADDTVTGDVGTAFAVIRGALNVVVDTIASWRAAGEVSVPAESVVAVDTPWGLLVVAEKAEGFDVLGGLDFLEVCAVTLSGLDVVPVGTSAGEGVCEAADCASARLGGSLSGLDVDCEPVCAPPVLTTTPGAGCEVVCDEVDAALHEAPDGPILGPRCVDNADDVASDVAPSPDVDELADDELVDEESDPDCVDGEADATPEPDNTAAPKPKAAASPPIRATHSAAPTSS